MNNFVIKLIGFIVGVAVVFALEVALFYLLSTLLDLRFMPRGIGWAVLPIVAGVGLANIFPELIIDIYNKICTSSKLTRIALSFPLLWVFIVSTYVVLFKPYGYMYSSDYLHMIKIMFFPPFIMGIIYFVYKKFIVVAIEK